MGKIVLITGCSTGFGNLTAKLLSSKGYCVYAGARKEKDLIDLEGIGNLNPVLLDITWSKEKVENVIDKIIKKEGCIDVVVNNAGFGYIGLVGDFLEDELRDQFETNFFGQFKIIKSVLPLMRKRGKGLIININTISGLVSTAFYGVYSASKFALDAITTSLRFEEAVRGISFVAVYPGSFNTNFWENLNWAKNSPETNEKIKKIANKMKWHRGSPIKVVNKLAQIIEKENPKKNYLVGIDAYLIYCVFKFLPYCIIDWIGKKIVSRIVIRK